MAVNETLELATDLLRLGVALLPAVVNGVDPVRFTALERRRLHAEPPDLPSALLPFAAIGRFGLARQRAAERQIRRLAKALPDRPVCLPHVEASSFQLPAIERLADALAHARSANTRRAS
jgi:hypothetical protein